MSSLTDGERLAEIRQRIAADYLRHASAAMFDIEDINAILRLLGAKDREMAALHETIEAEREMKSSQEDIWRKEVQRLTVERDEAAAALAAMREPTEDVCRSPYALSTISPGGDERQWRHIWRWMYDAALSTLPTRSRDLLAVVEAAREYGESTRHVVMPWRGEKIFKAKCKLEDSLTALDAPKITAPTPE